MAHIGVIEALAEEGLKPAGIVGSSMGALVGAYYARWGSIEGLRKFAESRDVLSLIKLADFNFTSVSQGFIRGRNIEKLLEQLIGKVSFRHLKIPLAVTATDIYRGQRVVLREGSVIKAVRASISIPAIFAPSCLKGRVLIDGGIVEPLPVLAAKKAGGEFIVASNVLKPYIPRPARKETFLKSAVFQYLPPIYRSKFFPISGRKKKASCLNIFQTVVQSFYAMEYELIRKEAKNADILIECGVERFGAFEFHRAREIIKAGYAACRKALGAAGYL